MKSVIVLMMSLMLAGPVSAADWVQGVLEALRAEYGFPGASVAWTGLDETVDVRTTGFADPEAGLPMTPETTQLQQQNV